jgi:pilus assembly protein Flp/PilA
MAIAGLRRLPQGDGGETNSQSKALIMPKTFKDDENGATAVEYGLIVAMIAAVSMTTWKTIGQNLLTHWSAVEQVIPADVAGINKPTVIDETTGNPNP